MKKAKSKRQILRGVRALLTQSDDSLCRFDDLFATWVLRYPELIPHLDPEQKLHNEILMKLLAHPATTPEFRQKLAKNPKICPVIL